MTPRFFRYELALLTILCIVCLFLFPAAVGSYPSVHGPVTALLAVRAAMKVRWAMAMAMAGLGFCHFILNSWLGLASWRQTCGLLITSPPEYNVTLRC